MNADCIDETRLESHDSVAHAIYFPSEHQSLFGWLHMPVGVATANTAMVICSPFGYEAICSHRSLLAFARAAASIGVPTLRFDYRGTGDSEDIDPQANLLPVWSADTLAAVDEVQRRTGVGRVCLLGFRLGALVASLAAAQREAVQAVIAIAPVTDGRRYLKELRTIQLATGQKRASTAVDDARAMAISGFSLSSATLAALEEIDLRMLNLPDVPKKVLVIDRSESPGARAWADATRERGAQVEYVALPGFVRMMMTAPHLTLVPQSMVEATRNWLTGHISGEQSGGGQNCAPQRQNFDSSRLRIPVVAAQSGEYLTENLILIPCESTKLFGIITEPCCDKLPSKAIILLNAGATHHVGPNRMYVMLARRWAEHGYLVLRIDLGGLGDSLPAPNKPENEVYPSTAVEEIRAAVDFMRARFGITSIALGGLCSGAFHALRAAVAGVTVTRIIMVNPLNFFWQEGKTQSDLLRLGFIHNPNLYLRQNIPSRFWKKLFSGQVNVRRLLEIYAKYGFELSEWITRDVARVLGLQLQRDLGNELLGIASRGVDIVFLFACGEPGIALLRHQAGSALRRLDQLCRVRLIDGADHIFSQSEPRAVLESVFSEELFAPAISTLNAISTPGESHSNQEPVGE